MAVTLLEASKRFEGNVLRQAVVELYASSSNLLRILPFNDIAGNALRYNQESALPGIGFRGVNEAYSESTGVINPITEPLVIAGGDLDVDKFITTTMGANQRTSQEVMKIKALAHKWTNTFIKGDSTSSPKEFDGLQVRLTGSQLIAAGATAGGDALSLAKLDQAIDATDNPTHILMSKAMRRLMTAAGRTTSVGGYIHFTQDEFGRTQTMYNDLPIIVVGENTDVYNTLDFVEANPGGGASVGTSIYVVSVGDGMLSGIQNGPPDVRDLGDLQTTSAERTRIEWYSGLALFHPRAATRLYGIKNSAVVA